MCLVVYVTLLSDLFLLITLILPISEEMRGLKITHKKQPLRIGQFSFTDKSSVESLYLYFLRKKSGVRCGLRVMVVVFNATQQYFSYIVAVSFIGAGNRSTRRRKHPP
jgi:hypothetical protein